jgi:predicted nuclease of predicted toxin-antitoxin system
MDVHVPAAITVELRRRGVDVVTAQEDAADQLADPDLLDRARARGRVLFTRDDDFLREGARRQRTGQPLAGIVYAHQLRVSIGQCIDDLELIAKIDEPADWANRVEYLPL